jgi:putative RNA 2'-phosphotransferase
MNEKETTRISKFLSLVLRHEPGKIGITLDKEGWVSVDELIAALNRKGMKIDFEKLEHVVETNEKKRFAFSDDGEMIRASQGHSVEVSLGYPPAVPPDLLYHGTVARFLPNIRETGILKGQRHHVHLSASLDVATTVGQRRGQPVILCVRAKDMHDAGHVFHISANGVWLTDLVPADFVKFEG